MTQAMVWRWAPLALSAVMTVGVAGSATAADLLERRTYSYVAPARVAEPPPLYAPVVRERVYEYVPAVRERRIYEDVPVVERRVYNYAPAVHERRVYSYAPVVRERRVYDVPPPSEARVVTRGTVYGYGPTYGYVAAPVASETVVVEQENRPLGVYAPETSQNLSPSRRFFRAITQQSGGD